MAKLIFGMNQSLDGFVDHQEFRPDPALFRHFVERARDLTGSVYGRRIYEVMRYWDEDHPEWDADEQDFAAAWRSHAGAGFPQGSFAMHLTPHLVLVLAGFAIFVGALGSAWLRGWLAERRPRA